MVFRAHRYNGRLKSRAANTRKIGAQVGRDATSALHDMQLYQVLRDLRMLFSMGVQVPHEGECLNS